MKLKKHEPTSVTDAERAQAELESAGMVNIVQSSDEIDAEYLHLPSDLSDLPPRDLGKYLNAFTMQMIWIRTLMIRLDALIMEVNGELDKIRAKLYPTMDKKVSVTEKELALLTSPEGEQLVEQLRFLQQKRTILDANWESLNDAKFNVSREISLRVGEQKDFNRVESVEKLKRGEVKRGY